MAFGLMLCVPNDHFYRFVVIPTGVPTVYSRCTVCRLSLVVPWFTAVSAVLLFRGVTEEQCTEGGFGVGGPIPVLVYGVSFGVRPGGNI